MMYAYMLFYVILLSMRTRWLHENLMMKRLLFFMFTCKRNQKMRKPFWGYVEIVLGLKKKLKSEYAAKSSSPKFQHKIRF